jgi:hypothetical protein
MKAWTAAIGTVAALAIAGLPASASIGAADQTLSLSAASKKSKAKTPKALRVPPGGQVACTVSGCHPIPPGCHPETGYDWDGLPTGFDIVVCRRGYGAAR